MTAKHLTRRIAAAALAAALALGGVSGVGAAAAVDRSDAPQEHAGATWTHPGATTNGATWS